MASESELNPVIDEQVKCDMQGCWKTSKLKDGGLLVEPITSEEAAQFQAEHRF